MQKHTIVATTKKYKKRGTPEKDKVVFIKWGITDWSFKLIALIKAI